MNKPLRLFLLLTFFTTSVQAMDWNIGLKGGFGGTGIKKTVSVDGTEVEASKSEGPGVVGISLEKVLSDKWSFAVEHRRGFRFGPFSSGVGFTDATWRWYYLGAVPAIIGSSISDFIFTKRWAPFIGGAAGIAFGTITREGDKVTSVDSSGVIMGTKIGADYHYKSNLVLRPELVVSSTFMNSGAVPESMSEFGLMFGMVFSY